MREDPYFVEGASPEEMIDALRRALKARAILVVAVRGVLADKCETALIALGDAPDKPPSEVDQAQLAAEVILSVDAQPTFRQLVDSVVQARRHEGAAPHIGDQ